MTATANRFPGEWTIRTEKDFGFEITRALGNGQSEWLKDETGNEVVFDTHQEATEYLATR